MYSVIINQRTFLEIKDVVVHKPTKKITINTYHTQEIKEEK